MTDAELPRRGELEQALTGLREPPDPQDGACLTWAPTVTERLWLADFPDARTVDAIGWLDKESKVIGLVHVVTLVYGHVVDFTARQFFDVDLPARWIAPVGEYCTELAKATGVREVTIEESVGMSSLPDRIRAEAVRQNAVGEEALFLFADALETLWKGNGDSETPLTVLLAGIADNTRAASECLREKGKGLSRVKEMWRAWLTDFRMTQNDQFVFNVTLEREPDRTVQVFIDDRRKAKLLSKALNNWIGEGASDDRRPI